MKINLKGISSKSVDYLPFYGVLIVFTAGLNIVDAFITAILLQTGKGVEMNPLMAALIELGMGWFLAFKLIMGALVFPYWWKLVLNNPQTCPKWPTWMCFIFYYLVILNNFTSALWIVFDHFS